MSLDGEIYVPTPLNEIEPHTIKDCLVLRPLSYLVPTQQVAPLVSLAQIETGDESLYEEQPASHLTQMRDALNHDPAYFGEVISHYAEDFYCSDEELEEIQFKLPIAPDHDLAPPAAAQESQNIFGMSAFERVLFEMVEPVCLENAVPSQLCVQSKSLRIVEDPSLSIGLQASPLPPPVVPKRSLEAEPAVPKKLPKTISVNLQEVSTGMVQQLVELVQQVGLNDSDQGRGWLRIDELHTVVDTAILDTFAYFLHVIITGDSTQSDPAKQSIRLIDVEYLARIQSICAKSIEGCQSLTWSALTESADHDQVAALVGWAINGLKAVSLILTVFQCGRSEKQLFLEHHLECMITFLYSFTQDAIIPLASLVSKDSSSLRPLYGNVALVMNKALARLSRFAKENEINDTLITRLEYMSITVVFAEANIKDRTNVLGVSTFESLRLCHCDIICNIFQSKKDQQQFIVDEILSNFEKLPSHKVNSRQFKLTRGVSIQLATALLMQLLQTYNYQSYPLKKVFWKLTTKPEMSSNERTALAAEVALFQAASRAIYEESLATSNTIISGLINNIASHPDHAHKHGFETFLEDLLNVLQFPEWPAAETLLVSIMRTLMNVIDSGKYPSLFETFALEMAGLVGVKMLSLKNNSKPSFGVFSSAMSVQDFESYFGVYETVLSHLHGLSTKDATYTAPFNYQFLKFLVSVSSCVEDIEPKEPLPEVAASNADKTKLPLLKAMKEHYSKLLATADNPKFKAPEVAEHYTGDVLVQGYSEVLLSSDLLHLFDAFLSIVIRSLDSPKVKSRTKAIKNISLLMSKEPSLLSLPQITNSVSKRFNDSSALVRDSVIELLSHFIVSKPEVIEDFYMYICDRMDDTSVAVRKRVVKLSKEMYVATTNRPVKVLIAQRLLLRLDDEEESISELVTTNLLDLWFFSTILEIQNLSDNTQISHPVFRRIEVMIDILSQQDKYLGYFERFVKDQVLHKTELNSKYHAVIMTAVRLILDKAVDFIIDGVETEFHGQVEKSTGLIALFAKCDGRLITQDQLISLQPYLTNEESTGDTICYYALQIFRYALPETRNFRPAFIDEAHKSLLRRLTKFNVKELNEAMPCVWTLSQLKKDTLTITNAFVSCLKLVAPFVEEANSQKPFKSSIKLKRLLYLIGNFGKYCDFEPNRAIVLEARVGLKSKDSVVSLVTKILLIFSKLTVEPDIRRIAIKNLLHVCSTHPKLFMIDAVLQIMDSGFAGQDTDIKEVIIQSLYDFLSKEEEDSIKRNGLDAKVSHDMKLDVAVFHGETSSYVTDGICSTIVQRYLTEILECCLQEKGVFSFMPVKYLQLVVRLGFANPKICTPTIIALEASTADLTRNVAVDIHKELHEKYESLIETSYIEGIKLAVRFRLRAAGSLIINEHRFLSTFYSVVGTNKAARRKFVTSLVKSFVFEPTRLPLELLVFHKSYVTYLVFNIVHAEFVMLEEVYILVKGIDSFISSGGVDLGFSISELMGDQGEKRLEPYTKLALSSQILLVMIGFREYLINSYSLSTEKLMSFLAKIDKDMAVAPKAVKSHPLDLYESELNADLRLIEVCSRICSTFCHKIESLTNGQATMEVPDASEDDLG
ncbi:hypothetical protein BABINDRAFT_61140 [Babjeviella inositovora NRRL Y-12698]|uniref:Sister chromatid cohesion protein n=1 Tax=Babjeviella inositovora NRRL Y-12698 TaxID=984486 RepID=A0A1E3QQY0_9ASCO|nr:uncharacterized protein BABINDRAFT_61140 [Babjeviella inositovora NRRL Y-12698]ODQ80095.1 hypothetical protein BABINDRAFT_61140 [Babjeviella inositovora NRRL Y-12698]